MPTAAAPTAAPPTTARLVVRRATPATDTGVRGRPTRASARPRDSPRSSRFPIASWWPERGVLSPSSVPRRRPRTGSCTPPCTSGRRRQCPEQHDTARPDRGRPPLPDLTDPAMSGTCRGRWWSHLLDVPHRRPVGPDAGEAGERPAFVQREPDVAAFGLLNSLNELNGSTQRLSDPATASSALTSRCGCWSCSVRLRVQQLTALLPACASSRTSSPQQRCPL